jgi:hypothetical protein
VSKPGFGEMVAQPARSTGAVSAMIESVHERRAMSLLSSVGGPADRNR